MIESYRDYFKNLCEAHTQLLHQDVDGERVFEMVNLSTAFGQLRDGCRPQSFIFRLIRPRRTFPRIGQQTFRSLSGGFVIARFGDTREAGDQVIEEALDACMKIADEFVARMVADSQNGHPLFEYSADRADQLSFQAIPITEIGDNTYHGYSCDFEISNEFLHTSACDPASWNDGGLSIY